MNIQEATFAYEDWVSKSIVLIQSDLAQKHALMRENAFGFLRASYYRWVQIWPDICSDLTNAPIVLGIGDIHTDNFGSWRDSEGRLTWGINDFDEAYPLPYTSDLVRLATSVLIASKEHKLALSPDNAVNEILEGYKQALDSGGMPFTLAESNTELQSMITQQAGDPAHFWQKLSSLAKPDELIPESVVKYLDQAMPTRNLPYRVVHRQSGLGSLGHRRYVALVQWNGGFVAREAKELSPSASFWLRNAPAPYESYYDVIISGAVRNPDPFVSTHSPWLLRRLAPDCRRISLDQISGGRHEEYLLHAMGFEIGNIHLGSKGKIELIQSDLAERPGRWLIKAAKTMSDAVINDWNDWRKN